MAPPSAPTSTSLAVESATGYPIIDVVEVKTAYGAPVPGYILVPAHFRPSSAEALIGAAVLIEPPGGWAILGKIAGTRDHGTTTSFLVQNWPEDFPSPQIGWMIRVPRFEGTEPSPG